MTTTALYLRTVDAQHRSHGGFQWPTSVGAEVVAPDWDPRPVCGNGLHGLRWGEGRAELLSLAPTAVWQVVEAADVDAVDLGGKHKFSRCVLRYIGDRAGAAAYILANGGAGRACAYAVVTAGDDGTATAGVGGAATAGVGGTATAGAGGTIVIAWVDAGRRRLAVGYVGEAGIEAGVAYALVGGRFAATDPA